MSSVKKIVIIEDEEANSDRLKRMILNLRSNYQIIEILSSINKSVDWLTSHDHPDLLFMDIQLSDGLSFEIFNQIELKCPVIFTTAYDEFAIKAFKFNSVDYLLKPVLKDELEFAIKKFEGLESSIGEKNTALKKLLTIIDKKEFRTRFLVPYKDGFKQIYVDSISYFFSEFGTTYAISFDGEKNLLDHTLESLEEQLDQKVFFRANRQYLVNINSISQVHNHFNSKLKVELKQLKNGIIISRLKATSFKKWLDY
ncbi:LytR/AlgR family response regulator transcription factor [Pararhodonellum marinum]|uniref:LytR/AlgR family response regulator transcription factor n=1 Tax=Pararhodonellum marinum TaxID=2755358 RepID=UPI00188F4037|nr:LytTR family DNA-binding domain-containing protein [Pararhodonellum marinum]